MKKRLFAILLCLVMIVGLLPAGALAAQNAPAATKFVEVTKLTADKDYVLAAVNDDAASPHSQQVAEAPPLPPN